MGNIFLGVQLKKKRAREEGSKTFLKTFHQICQIFHMSNVAKYSQRVTFGNEFDGLHITK